jgi:hypothetical protein
MARMETAVRETARIAPGNSRPAQHGGRLLLHTIQVEAEEAGAERPDPGDRRIFLSGHEELRIRRASRG